MKSKIHELIPAFKKAVSKKRLLISVGLTFAIFSTQNSFAQSHAHQNVSASGKIRCSTTEYLEARLKQDPEMAARREKIESDMQAWILNSKKNPQPQALVRIPVVVHVVYNTTAENIPDQYIQQQIDQLNLDYSKTNTDWASGTPAIFQSASANCDVQFCLAVKDPSGAATTGIVRVQTATTLFIDDDEIKKVTNGSVGWPSSQYLNIWLGTLGNNLLGYATPPGGPATLDGVVLHNATLPGPPACCTPNNYDWGRTATHEVGHWLNLYHIWAPGNGGCISDLVADTPPADMPHYNCPTHPLHVDNCGSSPNGEMFMNYMDYTDDNCLVMFTAGQKQRMQSCLSTTRSGLSGASLTKCAFDTDVNDLFSSESISIFPNPSNGNFSLTLNAPKITGGDLTIYNAIGETVLSRKISFASGSADVNMNNKPDGMYLIKIKTQEGTITKKVVINR